MVSIQNCSEDLKIKVDQKTWLVIAKKKRVNQLFEKGFFSTYQVIIFTHHSVYMKKSSNSDYQKNSNSNDRRHVRVLTIYV